MISEAVHFSQPVPPEGSAIEIYRDGEVEPFYSVNLFLSEPDSGTPGVQILFICKLEEKALVAVPQSAWHRTLSRRVLPPTALLKATLVEVTCARKSALDQLLEGQTIKVWIGFLGPEFIDHVQTHLGFFEAAHYFDDDEEDPMLPYAPALIEVAQEHFAFFSANEEEAVEEQEEPPELIPDESGSVPIEHRLLRLEQSLANLAKGVETMLKEKTPKPKATSKAKAVPANPKAKSNATVRAPALRKTKKNSEVGGADASASYPSLDPGVVAAALQAGVPKENLEEMEKLIGQNSKAAVVKDLNKVRLQDPLSEDEDATEMEMQKEDGAGSGAHADPVAQSLSKLTSIIQVLTDDRKKKDKSKLEEALDSVGASSTDSLGIGSGKKNAAARRALRATFEDHPEEIHRMIERLMYEDLQSQTLGPNQQPVGLNARSWVEFRSRIGNFKASAYAAWSAAGILDAMIAGNIPKARARTCLLLLMLDQASVDRGNWSMCGELSLEPGPPFASLSVHQGPSLQDGEQPFSKLLDPRIAEVILGHMKDQDDYLLRRRNVGRFAAKNGNQVEETEAEKAKKAKARAKAKAGASGSSQDA